MVPSSRRAVLCSALVGLTGVAAGCSGPGDRPTTPTRGSSTPAPTETTGAPRAQERVEVNSLDVINQRDESVTVTVSLTALGGRYQGVGSPTATEGSTPFPETPEEMFSETFELGPHRSDDDTKSYPYFKRRKTSGHRLDVSIQRGSGGSFLIDLPYGKDRGFRVYIEEDGIRGSR